MYKCIWIQSNLAVTPVSLITTWMINLLWSAAVHVFVTAASYIHSLPSQRKETENPRYSEKREGCRSGEFQLYHFFFFFLLVCNHISLIWNETSLYLHLILINPCSLSSFHNFCFVDYSVCDEHFNTPSPASQPRGPIQNWIHQKHSTSLWLWLFTGKMIMRLLFVCVCAWK